MGRTAVEPLVGWNGGSFVGRNLGLMLEFNARSQHLPAAGKAALLGQWAGSEPPLPRVAHDAELS